MVTFFNASNLTWKTDCNEQCINEFRLILTFKSISLSSQRLFKSPWLSFDTTVSHKWLQVCQDIWPISWKISGFRAQFWWHLHSLGPFSWHKSVLYLHINICAYIYIYLSFGDFPTGHPAYCCHSTGISLHLNHVYYIHRKKIELSCEILLQLSCFYHLG